MEGPKDIMQRKFFAPNTSGNVDNTGAVVKNDTVQGGTPSPALGQGLINTLGKVVTTAGHAAAQTLKTAMAHPELPELTNNFGIPTGNITHSLNINGHPLVSDVHLMEKQQTFNRSKIRERAVHACGSGGHGYFEVTHDVSAFCKAKFLSSVGKRTPVTARFSTTTFGREFPDEGRNPRGLAWKFYTEDGNYDILSINFPVFFCRDPVQGPDVIRSQQRNPQNFMLNYDATFDFMSLVPESSLANTWFWSDHGHPFGWRHMDSFPCHTFKWVNAAGEAFFVKYHFVSDQGIKNLAWDEAVKTCGVDPDFSKRELWEHINNGGTTSWTTAVQIMPAAEAAGYRWDPFDNTKTWPETDYPLRPFGRIVIDKNPENYHRDIEQVAFSPGRLVPGIEPSPDLLLQFRLWFYSDAQYHRLGVNYQQIPVNCPFMAKHNHPFARDGAMRTDTNGGAEPHYFPNSVDPPLKAKTDPAYNWKPELASGVIDRKGYSKHELIPDDDYIQATDFYVRMSPVERQHLHYNVATTLPKVSRPAIQFRFLAQCFKIHPEYAAGILDEARKLGYVAFADSMPIGKIQAAVASVPDLVNRLDYTPTI